MIAVNTQTLIFLQSLLMGAALGAVYDLFRIFRIAVPLPAGAIVAEDVIYFVFCGFFLFNDDSKFRTGAFFYFVGGTDWLFAVLFNHRSLGDERCPADHFWHPVLFSTGLEMDAAPGGSPAWMGRQENQKNSQKTGKKYEKSCAKTQKTLANKADNIV